MSEDQHQQEFECSFEAAIKGAFYADEMRTMLAEGRSGDPFSNRGFQATVERAGKAAGFGMKIHPHMLRHACGYKLANDGVDTRTIQAYLGHKSIQHTVRYTELAPTRFKSLFRD